MCSFEINSEFAPKGDQKAAIENISSNLNHGAKRQTLLGVTGSGKTFTMASVISKIKRPALVICLLYTSPSPRDATLSRMPCYA
mgnify:CR=1 FL=1